MSTEKRFRGAGQTFLIVAFGVGVGIVGVATSFRLPTAGGVFQAAACLGISAVVIAGPGRAAVWVSPDGIRIRNTLSTTKIPWTEIRGFRIGRHGLLGAVCIVDLDDGSSTHAFAIQVPHTAINRPDAKARKAVDELNQILEQHRARPAGAP
jgi:Bacterial PH domain